MELNLTDYLHIKEIRKANICPKKHFDRFSKDNVKINLEKNNLICQISIVDNYYEIRSHLPMWKGFICFGHQIQKAYPYTNSK